MGFTFGSAGGDGGFRIGPPGGGAPAGPSVSDNFNRADANPIGGNWTAVPGSSPVQLLANQAASTTTAQYSTVYWNADVFPPDQFSQITAVTQFHFAYVVVRASAVANTYYMFRGGSATPWRLFKMVAGVPTQIGSDYAAAVSGQVVKLSVAGNVLTPYINGVAQAPVTDSSITSGQPGFGMWDTNGFIDNWSAGPSGAAVRGPASFFVSNTGNDANAGTDPGHPWAHAPGMSGATGNAASAALIPGDAILLKCGDSWLNTTLTAPVGGNSTGQITLSAYGTGAKPIISAAANNPAITVTNANLGYWTINGLDLRASGIISGISLPATIYHNYWSSDLLPVPNWIIQNCVSNASFYLSGPNTTVRNNVLDGTGNSNPPYGGIILRSQVNTNGLVEGNDVSHFKDRGIWINRGANNATIRYNTVHHILTGSDNTGMGVNMDGFEVAVLNAQTYGNWIHHCDGIGVTHENGIGSKVNYNLIHDCAQGGVDVINYSTYQTQASNIEINYNVIFNTNVGIMILDAQTIVSIGNTIYQGTGANSFGYGIWTVDTNVSHLTFQNNIVAGSWTHPIQVRTSKAIWDAFDYNDIVPTGTEVVYQAGTTVSQTLAQLQALGLMTHGITADPQFVSTVTPDFSLAPGSPARTGVNLGAAYQQALSPSTVWPTSINLGAQAAQWNMGAYL